ncbi:MAG TPA: gluconolaconase, partial [Gammaproteobacteria bacterium]|nr:gluconolaconase [Gammaproteobacteria bacterium]
GEVSVLIDGAPLAIPNGVAIDGNGDVVVVNIGDNAVLTFSP